MADLALHSTHSTLRERIVEHVFVGDALRTLWKRDITDVEVLRSEFDAHGYDLVMARGSIVRHIQFKTGIQDKPSPVSVARALAEKPSGCVIWICVTLDLVIGPFWWFGGNPDEPLPDLLGFKNPKRNGRNKAGDRPPRIKHSNVPARYSQRIDGIEAMLETLFGPLPDGAGPPLVGDEPSAK